MGYRRPQWRPGCPKYHPETRGEPALAARRRPRARARVRRPRRRAAAASGAPEFAARRSVFFGARAAGGRAALRWQLGTLRQYGGTFFFFRSEMDPLNTLWLAPVGSAIVGAPLFRYQAAPPMVMAARCAGLPLREASARRGDGTYPSPGGCTVCFAAELRLLVSYGR